MSIQNQSVLDAPILDFQNTEDYADILKFYHLGFIENGYHLRVGTSPIESGWIFHLSIIASQIPSALKVVLPVLLHEQVSFEIPTSKEMAKAILNGQLGYTQLGKIMSIYPKGDAQILRIARELLDLTKQFVGPQILTDRHLGSALYVRYGAHNPLHTQDINGIHQNSFLDQSGQLVQDIYTIPFDLPAGIQWPFVEFATPRTPPPDTILRNRYKPMRLLKEDARGNVTKSLRLGRFGQPTWCVLKEGKRHMFADDQGRDIRDRLKWQYQVHQDLYGAVPVPKAYELFEENGDTYLSVEFIKGKPLDQLITSLTNDLHWSELPRKARLELVNHATRIVLLVQKLHQKGYVHRDINYGNIIVGKNKDHFIIDLELCYSVGDRKPDPPFRYGTSWFMSPEQQAVQTPTVKEDIYALGCTLITTLTGLLPSKFSAADPDILCKQLFFYMPDTEAVRITAQCLHAEPAARPTVEALYQTLVEYRSRLETASHTQSPLQKLGYPDRAYLNSTITRSIQALASPLMRNKIHLWTSKVIQDLSVAYYQNESSAIYPGFCIGVSGVYFVLARAHRAGFDTGPCHHALTQAVDYLKRTLTRTPQMPAGLYTGASGIAVALSEGLSARMLDPEDHLTHLMQSCLENRAVQGLDIAKGEAGRGIALLKASLFLDPSFVKRHLDQSVDVILGHQQKGGTFRLTPHLSNRILPGFAGGSAGLALFLLLYGDRYNDIHVKEAADRSLRSLLKESVKRKGTITWRDHSRSANIAFGLQAGTAGIALTLLKGYEILQAPLYRDTAERALRSIPAYPVTRDITLDTGLTGVGETYLEAYRSLHAEEWSHRAGWIANSCLHQFQQQDDGSRYWLPDHTPYSTADLLTGNSGILHFLIRCAQPDQFSHPLLPDE